MVDIHAARAKTFSARAAHSKNEKVQLKEMAEALHEMSFVLQSLRDDLELLKNR